MSETRIITLHQPWASLIAVGAQRIITRPKATDYRGDVLIHAGKRQNAIGLDFWEAHGANASPIHAALSEAGLGIAPYADLPLGAVVAVATLVDCLPIREDYTEAEAEEHYGALDPRIGVRADGLSLWPPDECGWVWNAVDITDQLPYGDYSDGMFGWMLSDVRPLSTPVSAKGRQGLTVADPALVAACTAVTA